MRNFDDFYIAFAPTKLEKGARKGSYIN